MIAGCIDRISADGCGGCERRDACAELFAGLFGPNGARPRWRPRREPVPRSTWGNLFFSVLGEVARNVERNVEARQAAARAEVPPRPSRPKAAPAAMRTPAPPAEPGPFAREVERHLEPLLASGAIGVAAIARALGYSRQTLYRRLKSEGVTFEEVLDGLRRKLALRFIREDGLSVKEAAWRLGFSDPAAFSRAYKRWTGTTPGTSRSSSARRH